jgi:hypothetical protein
MVGLRAFIKDLLVRRKATDCCAVRKEVIKLGIQTGQEWVSLKGGVSSVNNLHSILFLFEGWDLAAYFSFMMA